MSVFMKIIAWDIPSYTIYEDELVYAFLDIRPLQLGHTLIIPKLEIDHMMDVPEPHYSHIWKIAKKIGKALKQSTESTRISTLVLGMQVPHAHLHLIPINSENDIRPENAHELDTETMKAIQEKIISYL